MKLNSYISDNAVFQQGKPIVICGAAKADCSVFATLCSANYKESVTDKTDSSGAFLLSMPPAQGSFELYRLSVTCGEDTKQVDNILIGDVYIAAGQSNMAYPVSAMENASEIVKQSKKEKYLRLLNPADAFYVDGRISRPAVPQSDFLVCDGFKQFCNSAALKNISGIGAMFAQLITKTANVPVAIINVAVGGSSIDSWIPETDIHSCEDVIYYMKQNGLCYFNDASLANKGRSYTFAAGIFNEKISPLKNVAIKGVLWYQGESSAADFKTGKYYLSAFNLLVKSYRKFFSDDSLPFICSHIAPLYYPNCGMGVCYVNEALTLAAQQDKNVFTAPVYDIEPRFNNVDGNTYYAPIHPTNKKTVAWRLAYLAKNLYGSGGNNFPYITKLERRDDCIIAQTSSNKLIGENLFGFTICGKDGNYYQAKAKILAENRIMVYNNSIKNPQNICYAFFPINGECDIKDKNGLALMPYRSCYIDADDWFVPKPFITCAIKTVFSNNFDTFYDKNCQEQVWASGTINGTGDCKISISNQTVTADYNPNAKTMFLVGLSPKADFAGIPLQLHKFKHLSFCVQSTNDCSFFGLFFKAAGGVGYRFCANNGNLSLSSVPIAKGEAKVTINLQQVIRCDEFCFDATEDLLDTIYELQFTFRDSSKGKISLYNMELI